LIPMCSETGPCPNCKRVARFMVVDFDRRFIRVECSGKCGRFEVPKSRIDDSLDFDATLGERAREHS
jgi:hypothetical protein